jgi:hypothetical protein
MVPVKQDRHDIGIQKQKRSFPAGLGRRALTTKLSDHFDEGIDFGRVAIVGGIEVAHWGLEPRDGHLRGQLLGLTTFGINPVYRILRRPVYEMEPLG